MRMSCSPNRGPQFLELSREVLEQAQRLCREDGRTLSDLVEDLVSREFERRGGGAPEPSQAGPEPRS